jgi:AAA+ superfamily predicted ATPase
MFKDEKLFFIYSNSDALNDEFVYGLEVLNFEEALFRHLKELGYKRIVFYNGVDGLYTYEDGMLHFKKRSKKKKRLSGLVSREEKEEDELLKLQKSMPETEMLQKLETFMKNEKKGVFIITDFFSLLNHLNQEELKQLNQLILDFKQLDVTNDSLLFFLEPSKASLNFIKEKIKNYRYLENLIHFINESKDNLIEIGKASDDEVRNLLNHLRIKYSLPTNFAELETISKNVARYLRQNYDFNLKDDVHKKILNISKIDYETINNKLKLKSDKTGWDKFDELVGVDEVKNQIKEIVEWVKEQKQEDTKFEGDIKRFNKIKEKKFKAHLNIALKGSPGTGKTTIAKIIGDIFKEEGILSYGHFIKSSVDDFVAGYVGQTPIKTAELMKKAKGGVLFLDEAYGLVPDTAREGGGDFKGEAIKMIIDKLSEYEGEICMIVAGYEKDIEKLFETNEGWNRRFPNQITLRDYRSNELKEIFLRVVKKNNVKLDEELQNILDEFFERAYKSGFTKKYNAGFSEILFNSLMQKKKGGILKIDGIPEEFRQFLPTKYQNININDEIYKEINSLTGLENVKNELKKIVASIRASKIRGDIVQIPHYVFTGNPGTGKTTVARLLAKIFQEMGILKGKFLDITAKDLISPVLGETSNLVEKKVKEAKGGVLFIDEAYSLINTSSGKDAVDTLIREMENQRGEFCLIMAGYTEDMEQLLKTNAGFSSRIGKKIEFEDYNEVELFEILINFIKNNHFEITLEAEEEVKYKIAEILQNKSSDFGNAREMRKLFDTIKEQVDLRINEKYLNNENVTEEEARLIVAEDIRKI